MRIPLVTLAFGILAAVLFSQLPEFAQQYRQRLGGVVDELSRVVGRFQSDVDARKMTWDAAIDRWLKDPDELVRSQGSHMVDDRARLLRLESQQMSFKEAGPGKRILVMLRDFDPETAGRALQNFEPAVPTTTEGLFTTLVGFVFGGGLTRLIGAPFRRRQAPAPAYAAAGTAPRAQDEPSRAEAIRLRQRINKAALPRPGLSRDRREV